MKTIHRSFPLLLMVIFFSFSQIAMAQSPETDILAKAGSHVITHEDFEEAMQGDGNDQYQLLEDRLDLLKELVRIIIFSDKAREVGLDKDPELQRIINKVVNFHLARAYVHKYVKEAIQVSEDEALKWYENHRSDFTEPEKLSIRQIFLSTNGPEVSPKEDKKALAQLLLERIQKGEDFGVLSEGFSDDEDLKNKGGNLGYIARGALSPEYEDAVFGLDVGQVSPIIEGSYGYSIFKNEGRKPETVKPFDEVRDTVIEVITQEKENERFLKTEKQLYEEYQVQVFEDKIK